MRAERAQLTGQLDILQETNTELHKQIEEFTLQSRCHVDECSSQESNGDNVKDVSIIRDKAWGGETSLNDLMEVPRMRRRLVQMENELKRTRSKLLNSQSTLKVTFGGAT